MEKYLIEFDKITLKPDFMLLVLLVLVLPVQETPKIIFWLLFLFFWIKDRGISSIFKDWDFLDSVLLTWLFSVFVGAYFSGINHKEWSGTTDTIVIVLTVLLVRKARYGSQQTRLILYTAILSCLIATLLGIWKLTWLNETEFLEFESVGHVNHTAIYLSLSISVLLSVLFAHWKNLCWQHRLLLLGVYACFSYAIALTESRAAIVVTMLVVLLSGVIWKQRKMLVIGLLAIFSSFIFGSYLISEKGVLQKQVSQVERGIVFQARSQIWNTAILAWQEYPVFGVGIKNYGEVTEEKISGWLEGSGADYNSENYLPYPHGHSLYINTLAERGIVGLSILILVLITLCYLLFQYKPDENDTNDYWMIWAASLGVTFITITIGFVNTTLHHEQALLIMIILGLWLGSTNNRKSV